MKTFQRSAIAALVLILCVAMLFPASAEDNGLIAENLELSTFRDVAVGGRLSVADSGSEVVGFEITTPPGKGSVELEDDGSFVYTPDAGKKGKDYFGYKAIDAEGKYSHEATVIIKIQKQKTRVTYSDMESNSSAWAAVKLAEDGIFIGEQLAGEYVFRPDESLSRAQFLAMCMKAADTELIYDMASTGFADDVETAAWARPYVATALSRGYVSGYTAAEGVVFSPDRNITAAEAAVILNNVMGLTDAVAVWYSFDDILPAWAVQGAANIASCGIVPEGLSFSDETLSRGEGAEMICRAMAVLEARG